MQYFSKRGEAPPSAGPAAVLVAIIAAMLLVFIIVIPPEDRVDVLNEESSSSNRNGNQDDIEDEPVRENLLLEEPGRIDFLAQTFIEHPLPVVNVFTSTQSEVLAERNVATIKKSLFSEQGATLGFEVKDVRNTDDALLGFTARDANAALMIYVNEEEVYNAQVVNGESYVVNLPANLLQSGNEIVFKTTSPGLAFWRTNGVELDNIKVIAEVTSTEAQVSKSTFIVSETEKTNLEEVVLRFQPECQFGEAGKLRVEINRREIYNAFPDCDVLMVPIEFPIDAVREGENEVVFSTDKGRYILSRIIVESELKEVDFPTYYFELSEEDYQDVRDGDRRLRLSMDFVDVVERKRGEVFLNGRATNFDTKEAEFVDDLSDDIVRGNNALKISPRKTLEIREVRIDLVD